VKDSATPGVGSAARGTTDRVLAEVVPASGGYDERRFLIVVALAGVGFGMTAPLTVLFAVSFGASDLLAGLAVSSVAISLLAVDVFGTEFVPRVDGRATIWFSLVIFGIGSLASAVAPDLAFAVGARVFQGVGAALFMGGALQVVVRLAPAAEAGRAIGAFNAAWFGGVAAGPLVGGYLAAQGSGQAGYRVAFVVCAVTCFAVAAGARLLLPPIPATRAPRVSLPRRPAPRAGLRMWPPLTLAAVGQAVRAGLVFTMIPLLGERRLGLGTALVGLALSVLAVVDIAAMRLGGGAADRVGRRLVLVGGLASGCATCALVPLVGGPASFALWCASAGVVVGVTWVVPAAVVVDVAEDAEAGLASYRISADVGQLLGSTAAGALVGLMGLVGSLLLVAGGFALLAVWVVRLRETAALAAHGEGRGGPGHGFRTGRT
jgi:MFS family permease